MAVDQVTKYTYSMDASAAETLLAIRYTAASTRARSRKREIEQICPPSSVPFEDEMRKSKRRRTTKNTGDIASRVRFKKKKKIRVIVCRVPYGRLGSKCESAIQAGDLDELKRLVVHGSQLRFTSRLCARAAEVGHLETLKWLRSERFPWDEETCARAALGGHLEVLEWARENECPWNDAEVCASAAKRGHLETLRWASQAGCAWDARVCECAAEGDNRDVLAWARADAVWHGRRDVLEWFREKQCLWDEDMCALAAERGVLQTLQWLRDARCPWDWATCAFAAWRGHLEVLKWARANGCPWDEETWKYAAKRGDAAVVRWLRLNGCPKKRVRWKVPLETVHVFRKETNRTSAPRGAVSSRQTPGV
jgi:hypothetical protein